MMYPLAQDKDGLEMQKNGKKLSPWLRVLTTPAYIEYKGSTELIPVNPQYDIKDAGWITGENEAIYGTSAIGCFFANDLITELNMPVGFLNLNLGGSSIASWLSREAIDSSEKVKNNFIAQEIYIEKSQWTEDNINVHLDMTTNFNQRINPVKNFRLSGILWYQGESDLYWTKEQYFDALELLQLSYSDLFNYSEGVLPLVYTQLAQYYYYGDGLMLLDRNIEFADFQKKSPDTRACISIYDIEPTYLPEAQCIHPEHKREVARRMLFAAKGLAYGSESYTAPTMSEWEIRDDSIYVKFDNVGDGIIINGETATGFAICGDDGVFNVAKAEVVSPDTIRVFSSDVSNPKCATYAYSVTNIYSNLYGTENGKVTLPVTPFKTSDIAVQYWIDKPWTDCETDNIWHFHNELNSAYYPLWESENAKFAYTESSAFSGNKGLEITSSDKSFSVSPKLTTKNGTKNEVFNDVDKNFSNYQTISVSLKNNSTEDVVLDNISFGINEIMSYSPVLINTDELSTVIPADGEWHTYIFDLNKLYLNDNKFVISSTNELLKNVQTIKFNFEAESESCLSIDHIRFTTNTENDGMGVNAELEHADNIIEYLVGVLVDIINKIIALF